jgi:hypothetical protein
MSNSNERNATSTTDPEPFLRQSTAQDAAARNEPLSTQEPPERAAREFWWGARQKNSSVDTWAQRRFAGTPRTCPGRRADQAGLNWGPGHLAICGPLGTTGTQQDVMSDWYVGKTFASRCSRRRGYSTRGCQRRVLPARASRECPLTGHLETLCGHGRVTPVGGGVTRRARRGPV